MPDQTRSICFDFSKVDRKPRSVLQAGPTSRLKGSPKCMFYADSWDGENSDIPRLVQPNSRVDVDKILHQGDYSTVFRGTLSDSDGTHVDRVVLKIASFDILGAESLVYDSKLSGLGGDAVPKFYGLYYCDDTDGKEIPCMMLQAFGEQVGRYIESMPQSEQATILHTVHRVHKEGVAPLDFAERNILVQDGKYMVVDFADVEIHQCLWSYDFLKRTDEPRSAEKGRLETECPVLYANVEQARFWEHGRVRFGNRTWRDPELPSQSDIYRTLPLTSAYGDTATVCDRQFWLYRHFREVNKRLKEGNSILSLNAQRLSLFDEVKESCRKEIGYMHAPRLGEDVDENTGRIEFLPRRTKPTPDSVDQSWLSS